jgi:nucleotide-binding universal stress UspA family protein
MKPFQRVLLATDLSRQCRPAFFHALKLVLGGKGELHLLHVDSERQAHFGDFPQVRERLSRWGLLPEHAPREAVAELGIRVFKQLDEGDPVEAIVGSAEDFDAELLVMATHARKGWSRLLSDSISEQALRQSQLPALLFPPGQEGFVEEETGQLHLQRVLLPLTRDPDPRPAQRALVRLLHTLGPASGQLLRVHVGEDRGLFEDLPCPPLPSGWTYRDQSLEGEVEASIVSLAAEFRPHLSVMTSKGRTSWKDLVWGSTLERLIDQLKSPVLVLPAELDL